MVIFDLLGYITLPHYRVLRTKTKKRMLKRVNQNNLASYRGLLKHCNGYRLEQVLDYRSPLRSISCSILNLRNLQIDITSAGRRVGNDMWRGLCKRDGVARRE